MFLGRQGFLFREPPQDRSVLEQRLAKRISVFLAPNQPTEKKDNYMNSGYFCSPLRLFV